MYKALINTDTDSDILDPFQNIVEATIFNDILTSFSVNDISKKLINNWSIEIPEMPLRAILGRLVTKGGIKKASNRASYYVVKRELFKETSENIRLQKEIIEEKFEYLISDFIDYTCSQKKYDLNREDAIKEVENFLRDQATAISLNRSISSNSNCICFSIYFLEKCLQNPKLLEILKSITFGYILSESLFMPEPYNKLSISNMKVILDTPVLFKLLGISEINDSAIYISMITDLQKMGANICTFNHCVDEVQQIIEGSIYWINNGLFDPLLASETTLYYANSGYSKADIEEDSLLLRSRIEELNISIIYENYDSSIHKFMQDESLIYNTIVDVYKQKNPNFSEVENKLTLELDSKSINQVYILREGSKSVNLNFCKAIFLTSNSSLVYASKKFNDVIYPSNHNLLGTCVKDVMIGTFIWLNNPMKLKELAVNQLIQHAYTIMTPSQQLWQRFTEELKKSLENGSVSEEQAYLLRTSSYIRRSLVKATMKELENISENTPTELIEELKNEGRKKAEEEYRNKISEIEQSNEIVIENLNNNILEKDNKLNDVNEKLNELFNIEVKKNIKCLDISVAAFFAIYYFLITYIFFFLFDINDNIGNFVTLFSTFTVFVIGFYAFNRNNSLNIYGKIYLNIKERIERRIRCKYFSD